MTVEVFAPAKINLCLHVTGQRADGYHLIDSLVAFADVGDTVTLTPATQISLSVTGPMAEGVPDDARNLCWRAAERFGEPVAITLHKMLPAAAGLGGGSSDAAAVIRGLSQMTGRAPGFDPAVLGADVPVCLHGSGARMQGIGEVITPVGMAPMPAVLVNPGVAVETPMVFLALMSKANPPLPSFGRMDRMAWLARTRNDLQPPAIALRPAIQDALDALSEARIARMSGSGATCFGLFHSDEDAEAAAARIRVARPDWWVQPCWLG